MGFHQEDCCETGGSSFDVVHGVVYLLDQNNSRVLTFAPSQESRSLPLRVTGQAFVLNPDLAVGADGTIHVLVGEALCESHKLWSFPARGGRPIATTLTIGERVLANGSAASVESADHWRQLMDAGRIAKGKWLPYRPLPGGGRLVVRPDAPHGLVRATLTEPNGTSTSWRISSPGQFRVEDTDAVGADLVLVLGFGNEDEVVVLGRRGIVRSFSTRSDYYVDAALYGNFRVEGRWLYRLGSTREGVYVDRYGL